MSKSAETSGASTTSPAGAASMKALAKLMLELPLPALQGRLDPSVNIGPASLTPGCGTKDVGMWGRGGDGHCAVLRAIASRATAIPWAASDVADTRRAFSVARRVAGSPADSRRPLPADFGRPSTPALSTTTNADKATPDLNTCTLHTLIQAIPLSLHHRTLRIDTGSQQGPHKQVWT